MKKFVVVMIAAVMAIGFSAFTGVKPKTTTYYWLSSSGFAIYPGSVCVEGSEVQCTRPKPGDPSEQVLIYKSADINDPLMYNP